MTGRRRRSLSEPRWISGLFLLASVAFCSRSNGQSQAYPKLDLKNPVQSMLVPGEARSWEIAGNEGDFLRISIQPNGLPLKIRLLAPDGSEAANISERAGESRAVSISHIALQTGNLVVECSLGNADVPARRFELQLSDHRPATDADRTRIQAEQLFEDARTFQ